MNKVQVVKIMYHDKIYYNLSASFDLLSRYREYAASIGDEAYLIDGELYIDEGALFNISLMDTESTFQIQ